MERIIASARGGTLKLGRQGENEAREIAFDISRWNEIYGKGAASLVHARCGDEYPYPCNITVEDDGLVVWVIKNADVANDGIGKCELTYAVDGVVVKSVIWDTYVASSLMDVTEEIPDPARSWVDRVIETAARSGKSAYNIAQDNGFTGTEQEWLISLKGETGAIGPQGERGEPGQNGISSWLELKDRPFGEVETKTHTLEIDVAKLIADPDTIVVDDTYMRVSEHAPTVEEFAGAYGKIGPYKTPLFVLQYEVFGPDVAVISPFEGDINQDQIFGFVVYKDDHSVFLKKGIYLLSALEEAGGILTLTLPNYEITTTTYKKLDPKALPDGGFGYEETVGDDALIWDGEPTDVFVGDFGVTWYKVSDQTPISHLIGGIATMSDGSTVIIQVSDILIDGVAMVLNGLVAVAAEDNAETSNHIIFPEKGIYFAKLTTGYSVKALQLPNYSFGTIVTHKIDPKFLPDGGFGYEEKGSVSGDTITWDGEPTDVVVSDVTTGLGRVIMCRVSPAVPTKTQIIGGTFAYYYGATVTIQGDNITEYDDYYSIKDSDSFSFITVVLKDGGVVGQVKVPTAGIYFTKLANENGSIFPVSLQIPNFDFGAPVVHQIDKKFLPDTVAHVEDISKAIFGAMEASY